MSEAADGGPAMDEGAMQQILARIEAMATAQKENEAAFRKEIASLREENIALRESMAQRTFCFWPLPQPAASTSRRSLAAYGLWTCLRLCQGLSHSSCAIISC